MRVQFYKYENACCWLVISSRIYHALSRFMHWVWSFDRFSIIVPLIVSFIWLSELCHQKRLHSTNKRMRNAHTHLPHIHQFFFLIFFLFKIEQTGDHQISHSLLHFVWFGCSFFNFGFFMIHTSIGFHPKFCSHCNSGFTFWASTHWPLKTCLSFLISHSLWIAIVFLPIRWNGSMSFVCD